MTRSVDVNLINGIALAFEGDAIYSTYIRKHLIFQGLTNPNQLHRKTTRYVSAKAQAMLITKMLEAQLLSEKEEDIYRRGRNANSHTKAKNTDVVTYKMSTGFEAVMGYLHMTEQIKRLEELIDWCIQTVENEYSELNKG
ncbi:Mini-ribonuclease 3 [Streptococcus mutans]|uniref:Mini-ribonuclease 3 n=1 Tax=Streptococcus mutans TaxID=1309 RepID=UPI0014555DEC|nr:Mini-ribonuclease 3 [Streptococcus mutans]MCB4949232.1 Mini-ribonuclease 3 [Streptococcus mutans]MCB4960088.1 Mini-ribonuclease 3 [Streptococcus mutans]MCB4975167.1 Mini-ribonuclease 3 [Streptococcus mutans]MCB4977681.1 Mini-ribonuclease 3 [Streptococcus mutans]MCB4999404.1 Mini-ribonuclease 3 [Streptococcus mutans]